MGRLATGFRTAMHRMGRLLPAAALLAGLGTAAAGPGSARAASLGTTENTLFLPVWLGPGSAFDGHANPALLNLPPGWASGDAAVVLAPGGDWPPGTRDRLVAALLDAGAAVLEVNEAQSGQPQAAALRATMAEAVRVLHNVAGAGLVVAIGHGAGGEAALAAVEAAATPDGQPYAAAVRLGPGTPRFVRGEVPANEAWPARAPLLCDLLAGVQPDGGAQSGFGHACQASLVALR